MSGGRLLLNEECGLLGAGVGSIHSIAEKRSSRKPISKILYTPGPIGPELSGLPPDRYRVLPQDVVVLDGYAGSSAGS